MTIPIQRIERTLRTRFDRPPPGMNRKDIQTADQHHGLERRVKRIQEAVAIAMISDLPRWNLRLTETLTPHQRHLAHRVKHEVRIPSALDLAHSVLPGRDLPTADHKCRLYVPIAFLPKGTLLSGFTISSSHEPVNILNFTDGDAFTRRLLARLIPANFDATKPYFADASATLARTIQTRYIQFAEIEARLGEVVTIEYSNTFPHLEASTDKVATWRLSMGWRQNRYTFESELLHFAASYHFHFEVPDGFILKRISVKPKNHRAIPNYTFSGSGTPDGHIYVPLDRSRPQAKSSENYFLFIDCFESPPGSQGYTAIMGLVMAGILYVLMLALSHGWFIDSSTQKVQATGAIALIAGAPAVLASLLPLRNDPTAAIRPPLTARVALWASSAMSAYVALLLATQGFGIDLATMKNTAIIRCFFGGLTCIFSILAGLLLLHGVRRKRPTLSNEEKFWRYFFGIIPIPIVAYFVVTQPGHVSSTDYFFSVVIPLYLVILIRCIVGWVKSVLVASGIRRSFEPKSVVS
ncbi:hypothetical protein QN239_07060 [Mycolicibacterium sp. Y3]